MSNVKASAPDRFCPLTIGFIGVRNAEMWISDGTEVEFCTLNGKTRNPSAGEWVLACRDPAMEEDDIEIILGRTSRAQAIRLATNVILKRGGKASRPRQVKKYRGPCGQLD